MRMVSKLNCDPTGYCIQPLAIRIRGAEKVEPIATSQVTMTLHTVSGNNSHEEKDHECRFEEERHQAFDGERRVRVCRRA